MSASASLFHTQPPPTWLIPPSLSSPSPPPPLKPSLTKDHLRLSTPPPQTSNKTRPHSPTLEIEELPDGTTTPSGLEILYPDAYEDYHSPNSDIHNDTDVLSTTSSQALTPYPNTPITSNGIAHEHERAESTLAATSPSTIIQRLGRSLTRETTPSAGRKRRFSTSTRDADMSTSSSRHEHASRRVRRRLASPSLCSTHDVHAHGKVSAEAEAEMSGVDDVTDIRTSTAVRLEGRSRGVDGTSDGGIGNMEDGGAIVLGMLEGDNMDTTPDTSTPVHDFHDH